MTEWKPIGTAPKDGTPFLTFSPELATGPYGGVDVAGFDDEEAAFWKFRCGFDSVTHWMPLPEPPK